MSAFTLPGFDLDTFVRDTLAEDLGEGLPGGGRDVTSESVIPAGARFAGVMDTRDTIEVAGLGVAEAFFRALDPEMTIELLVADGESVAAGTDLMRLEGNARAMLTAERSALNTVQHLSGIATMVAEYVRAMDNPDCTLLDTRKTIPGLRQLEKYAVRMGGGSNHRMGLWDAAMIKDNHVLVAGSVGEAVRRAVAAGVSDIICEVDRIDQIEPALAAGATRLLLDNMEPDMLRDRGRFRIGRSAYAERTGSRYRSGLYPPLEYGQSPCARGGFAVRPPSIVWFERLFLLSLLIASIAMVTSFDTLVAQVEADPALAGLGWGRGAVIAISAISLLLPLVLWYFIARRASAFAKWLLVLLTVAGLLFLEIDIARVTAADTLMTLLVTLLQLVAIVLLFRADARAWLAGEDVVDGTP